MRRDRLGVALLAVALAASVLGGRSPAEPERDGPLLFGVVRFYHPRLMYLKYQPLVDYLGEQTGRRWELRLGRSYEQTVGELCSGRLTAAYLGPATYVRAHAACGAEALVRLRTGGRDTYRSYILVREDSTARTLTDLRGGSFAFGSALSTSSHIVPRAMLVEAGLEVGTTIRCLYFENHERAARAVLLGEADACGVRDIVGEKYCRRGLRVLAQSDPIPNFPIVVGPATGAEVRSRMMRALVELPRRDEAIAARIATWDEELAGGFVPSTDAEYDAIRTLAVEILGEGVLSSSEEELHCTGAAQ